MELDICSKFSLDFQPDSPYTLAYPGSLVDFLRQIESVKKFGKTYVELSNVLVSQFLIHFCTGAFHSRNGFLESGSTVLPSLLWLPLPEVDKRSGSAR